jgi:hypothetical protein
MWNAGQCERCYLRELCVAYFSDSLGVISNENLAVHDVLMSTADPKNAIRWLTRSAAAKEIGAIIKSGRRIVREDFAGTELGRPMTFARDLFISAGVFANVVDDTGPLATWFASRLSERTLSTEMRSIAKQFAQWVVYRDFRRLSRRQTAELNLKYSKNVLRGTLDFLHWLHSRGETLSSCNQAEIDVYFNTETTTIDDSRKFISWAVFKKYIRIIELPKRRKKNPVVASEEDRIKTLSRFLHDESLSIEIRAAGLLVGVYGQMPGRLRKLKKTDVLKNDNIVSIVGGREEPLELDDEIGNIVWRLRNRDVVHSGLASGAQNSWLFEGFRPGRPISDCALQRRFSLIGVKINGLRSAALIALGREVELPIVAGLLGISIDTAYRWWAAAGGKFKGYAGTHLG